MANIKAFWDLKKDDNGKVTLELFDSEVLLKRMGERWLKRDIIRRRLSTLFRAESEKKTNPQLRYLRGYLVPTIHDAMVELGNEFDEDKTYLILKDMFYNEEFYVEGIDKTMKLDESLADAGKERVSEFIDKCFRFAQIDLGIVVHTPKEYYAMMKKQREQDQLEQ